MHVPEHRTPSYPLHRQRNRPLATMDMGEAVAKEVYTYFATTTRAEHYKVAINQYLEVGKAIYIVA